MRKIFKSKLALFIIVLVLVGAQCFSVLQPMAAPEKNDNTKEDSIVKTGDNLNDVDVTVLESDSYHTIIRFDVNNFSKDLVKIDNEEYYTISCNDTGVAFDQGMPELPRISRSIAIPSNSTAKINVLSSEYTDYKNTPVNPSKGSITRDKDPKDIPYTFNDIYKKNDYYPSQLVSLSDTFIMREMTGTTVTVNAFQYKPASKTLRVYDSVTVEIITDVNSIVASDNGIITEDFVPAYENTFINYNDMQQSTQSLMNNPPETGSMLIITYDSFASALTPFVTWKNSKGINTTVVNMSTVSSTNSPTQIKSYIQTYYNAHPELTYVLLVGDYAQVSSPVYSDGVSDPEYTKVAGSDNYPDIYVGRFSAQTTADVDTQVRRSIEFEQNEHNTTTWFKKGLGLASAEGSGETDIEHMDIIKNKLISDGYTTIDSVYDPGALASSVTTSINASRGIINYVGHGSDTYWVTSGFSNTNIQSLQNAAHLPFILSVACVNGTFQKTTTCFAETWLRSKDSSGNPIGAIGTLMSTVNQPWVPPMNGQDKIIDLLIAESRISLGGLCYSGETVMLDNGTSDDILTFNTWTLFGDPSIQIVPEGTTPPPEDEDTYEPNGTTTAAYGPLTSATTYNSYIYSSTDIDYYHFTTGATGTIS
ncbi:MAG: C25 family cysteine peptidase, partial [Lutisporaceae bacterium]